MKELGEISLRMVKILLENGSLEVFGYKSFTNGISYRRNKRIISYEVWNKISIYIRIRYINRTFAIRFRYLLMNAVASLPAFILL